MSKRALIIVDVQHDFLPGGNLAVTDGDKIIPVINKLIPKFDMIIFSRDFHPKNHKSFISQNPNQRIFDTIVLNGTTQIVWPDHCVQGTRGSEIHEDLLGNPELKNKKVYIFKKGMDPNIDSYSAFRDNRGMHLTGLGDFLLSNEIEELFITGLVLGVCVSWTAIDASEFRYKTSVILDATKAIDNDIDLHIGQLKEFGIDTITSEKVK